MALSMHLFAGLGIGFGLRASKTQQFSIIQVCFSSHRASFFQICSFKTGNTSININPALY